MESRSIRFRWRCLPTCTAETRCSIIVRRNPVLTFEIVIGQAAAFFPLLGRLAALFLHAPSARRFDADSNAYSGMSTNALSWFVGFLYGPSRVARQRRSIGCSSSRRAPRARRARRSQALGKSRQRHRTAIDLDSIAVRLPRWLASPPAGDAGAQGQSARVLNGRLGERQEAPLPACRGRGFATGRMRVPEGCKALFPPQRP